MSGRAVLRRFAVGPLKFIRRPITEAPPDGTICIVDNGDAFGFTTRTAGKYAGGSWSNGKGRDLPFEPTHWITLNDGAVTHE